MKTKLVLTVMLVTIFLDMFNLGLIYPIFTSLIFEGNGGLVSSASSEFVKNSLFGLLISVFPLGQFLGAPILGQLSDHYGRRKLLIVSLFGTVATLLICALGVHIFSLALLFLGRFAGGMMAGNMTLAYASIADFSSEKEKVKNFALIPLMAGLGFAAGPYLAGIIAHPALSLLLASFFSLINLLLVLWKMPETALAKHKIHLFKEYLKNRVQLWGAFQKPNLKIYLIILFFMLSSNLLFIQFVGPFAIERFHIGVREVGYLYANIGISVALGHFFVTKRLADRLSPEKALRISLICLGALVIGALFLTSLILFHLFTFFIMLACAIGYTNSMVLISNHASKEEQGSAMGVAVSVQSCSEFLPALILGFIAALSEALPLIAAALSAFVSYFILINPSRKQVTK